MRMASMPIDALTSAGAPASAWYMTSASASSADAVIVSVDMMPPRSVLNNAVRRERRTECGRQGGRLPRYWDLYLGNRQRSRPCSGRRAAGHALFSALPAPVAVVVQNKVH